ncbi:00486ea4-b8f6-4ad3-b9d6-6cd1b5493fe9 [Thermothielavioides terrestris]|uniref:00486ea4-b8f6-4ad3-b9d6-6cd1b5493fe9 n=1 Tax=Thermothielavioides terrestris TaxID=2587410 RepID=A0A3S4B5I8_9PEZI|nr:00486ea4-b8f6-4ad3-b9d6-6cd1b5493fe9 [Thermothielavioides terrestris]
MPDAVKAAHYIQQLDDARCDDNWDAVPELVRKVRKHAPERACLALTAETEHAIAKASLKPSPSIHTDPGSTTANSAPAAAGLDAAKQLPALLSAVDAEANHPQDRFQARVCAGWLLWVLREYPAALARLPRSLLDDAEASQPPPPPAAPQTADGGTPPPPPSEWTRVCALKAAYLRANCLARDGQRAGALDAFGAALPGLGGVWAAGPAGARQQTRYWAELFLTEYCMLAAQALRDGARSLREADSLDCFRAWAQYWAAGAGKGGGGTVPGGYGFRGSVPRRQVWAEYYYAMSEILQGDLPLPTGYAVAASAGNESSSARSLLRAELKRVELIYQGLLFSETKFPRADEERAEVEDFVRRMMRNWAILNGRGWKEQDLGVGGRDALCRATLETLYGAAAKTYHSTAVLRHLFTVHLAVAEFDLAFMAFDSWLELVKKGRARVAKTGRREPALDDEATMFETISACIAALCRFGNREAAEKAHKLAAELEELVEQEEARDSDSADNLHGVPPNVMALAWQSIGLAQAQWARMTYDSESRASIQEKAIQCLRRSLSPDYGLALDARGVFALGVLYAEQRKLSASIELVKTALLADAAVEEGQELRLGPYWRERSLIQLWHLLALMLSARQEFLMAARACEGAIEQFKDPHVLFGSRGLNSTYRSEHLNEAGIKSGKAGDGLVDEMDDYEKESILQIKMTQLAILELVEGPAVAVNASTELLTLFLRLFGDLEHKVELAKAEPPKTAATLRSIRGSLFGGKPDKAARQQQSVVNNSEKLATIPSRPQTTQTTQTTQSVGTTALTMQTSNDGAADPHSSRRSTRSDDTKRRSRNSLRKRDRSGSRQRAVSVSGPPVPPLDGDKYFSSFDERNLPHYFAPKQTVEPPRTSQHEDSRRSSSRSRGLAAAANHHAEAAAVAQAVGSFVPLLPYVQFPPEHNRRRRMGILTKVWLIIAGFYRRAGLLDDAHKAIAEAQKVAQSLEADVVKNVSGPLPVRQVGWGMEKSAEEVLADVWAEKGNLSVAQERPYQARAEFETALTHFRDHPGAIVGLSNILLDIYTEKLLPPPAVPGPDLSGLSLSDDSIFISSTDSRTSATTHQTKEDSSKLPPLPSTPLGLGPTGAAKADRKPAAGTGEPNGDAPSPPSSGLLGPPLPPPHLATSLPLNDRLAARDRAYGLLVGLTKLGRGWNDGEAWLALARAYEESGQADRARDALWWCVELEDGRGVRGWDAVLAAGGL